MTDNKDELIACIERLEKWFCSDAIRFLNDVLADDEEDPQFSAVTTYQWLERAVTFEKLYYGKDYTDVENYLLKNGYSAEDVALLNKKRIDEEKIYVSWN